MNVLQACLREDLPDIFTEQRHGPNLLLKERLLSGDHDLHGCIDSALPERPGCWQDSKDLNSNQEREHEHG